MNTNRKQMSPARRLGTVVTTLGLLGMVSSGCAVNRGAGSGNDPIAQKVDSYLVEPGVISHEITDENVARLWQESEIFRRNGDLVNARGRLHQAIVITPDDAVLWSRAAEVELTQEEHVLAEDYAVKSNTLATVANRPLRFRNWLIIQRARERRGDLLGARQAEIESTRLGQ